MSSAKNIVLHGLSLMDGGLKSIAIRQGKIAAISEDRMNEEEGTTCIELENCLAFPGLINSHDHLDFNLFPPLGDGSYRNYMEWGPDIHAQHKELIRSVLGIPQPLRSQWGIYKNLLAGVTTVVQHGEPLFIEDSLIDVCTACTSLHSVGLEKKWRWKLNKPRAGRLPFVIHIGEGTNAAAHHEIDELLRWNLMKRKLIAVHGVAMSAAQAAGFEALVWCPESNHFLFGKTAEVGELKAATQILFGTDATVSADWNIWNHLRKARTMAMLDDDALRDSVSMAPAKVWGLSGKGMIQEGYDADIIVARKKAAYADNREQFFALNPEDLLLVMSRGRMVLFDETLYAQLNCLAGNDFSRIGIAGSAKLVRGNISALVKQIRQFYPGASLPIEVE